MAEVRLADLAALRKEQAEGIDYSLEYCVLTEDALLVYERELLQAQRDLISALKAEVLTLAVLQPNLDTPMQMSESTRQAAYVLRNAVLRLLESALSAHQPAGRE